jgi:hypothetical protein
MTRAAFASRSSSFVAFVGALNRDAIQRHQEQHQDISLSLPAVGISPQPALALIAIRSG